MRQVAKGIERILKERGCYPKGKKIRAKCTKPRCPDPAEYHSPVDQPPCCLARILQNHKDFREQESAIASVIKDTSSVKNNHRLPRKTLISLSRKFWTECLPPCLGGFEERLEVNPDRRPDPHRLQLPTSSLPRYWIPSNVSINWNISIGYRRFRGSCVPRLAEEEHPKLLFDCPTSAGQQEGSGATACLPICEQRFLWGGEPLEWDSELEGYGGRYARVLWTGVGAWSEAVLPFYLHYGRSLLLQHCLRLPEQKLPPLPPRGVMNQSKWAFPGPHIHVYRKEVFPMLNNCTHATNDLYAMWFYQIANIMPLEASTC